MTKKTEMTKKCPMCGEEYEDRDLRNPQPTCNKLTCKSNYDYQQAHYDPRTGKMPTAEEIGKW